MCSVTINNDTERDLIDQLIDDLNDGVNGVTFDRDVLDTDRPDDWGAVELSGDAYEEWADGVMVDQELSADIWVCVSERGSRVKRAVQAVLRQYARNHEAGWRFVRRAYLYDLDKVLWQWTVNIIGPLAADEEDEDETPSDDSGQGSTGDGDQSGDQDANSGTQSGSDTQDTAEGD